MGLAEFLRRGLVLDVGADKPARLVITLSFLPSGKRARVVIARFNASVIETNGRIRRVRLRARRGALPALRLATSVTAQLQVRATDADGRVTTTEEDVRFGPSRGADRDRRNPNEAGKTEG